MSDNPVRDLFDTMVMQPPAGGVDLDEVVRLGTRRRLRRNGTVAGSLLLLVIVVAAAGVAYLPREAPAPVATAPSVSPPTVPAVEVVRQAAAASLSQSSVHAVWDGAIPSPHPVTSLPRAHWSIRLTLPLSALEVADEIGGTPVPRLIVTNGIRYTRESGGWVAHPGAVSARQLDAMAAPVLLPLQSLAAPKAIDTAELVERQTVGGVASEHFRVSLPARSGQPVDVWVSNGLVTRYASSSGDGLTVEYGDYGAPVSIVAPAGAGG